MALDPDEQDSQNPEELPWYLQQPGSRPSLTGLAPATTPVAPPMRATPMPKSVSGMPPAAAPPPTSISGAPPAVPPEQTDTLGQPPLSAPAATGPNLAKDVLSGNVTPPQWKDYKPAHVGVGRKIAAGILGGLSGINDPKEGAQVTRSIAYGPQMQKLGEDTEQFKGALEQGKLGEAEELNREKPALGEAEINEKNAQAAALLNPQAKTEFEAYEKQHPNDPDVFGSFAKEKAAIEAAAKPGTAEQDTARATQLRADQDSGKTLSPEDTAWLKGHTQEKTIVPATTAIINAPEKNDARLDRSYQYNSTQLEKVRTPIDALSTRLGNLGTSLSQATPQSDALVAPELLSIMAGGQGSGLRMNEAEISRIVGGRSNWQSLQAAVQQWSLDPTKANSITTEQRKQIHALFDAVQGKVRAKQSALEDAEGQLLDANDPKDHRKIVADLRKKFDEIDAGAAEQHQVGDTKAFQNGNIGKWDGKGWVMQPKGQ